MRGDPWSRPASAQRFLSFMECSCCLCCSRDRSSYGEVYLARNKHTNEPVAVKVVPVEADLDDFMKEIDVLKRCSSPYVVSYVGSFLRDPDLYVRRLWCIVVALWAVACCFRRCPVCG